MKKLLILTIIAMLALSFTACGKESKKGNGSDIVKDNTSTEWIEPEGLPTETEEVAGDSADKDADTITVDELLGEDTDEEKYDDKTSTKPSASTSTTSSNASSTASNSSQKDESPSSQTGSTESKYEFISSKDSDTGYSKGWIN